MDEKTCKTAYDLARTFIEWKDMAGEVNDPVETQMAWRRLMMSEELFRRQLDGPDGRPCDGCPDLTDVRTFNENP